MEIHTNDKKPRADRPNVDLSKKVTRETPSAHRSIRTVSTVISPRKNNGDTIIQNTRNAVKKTTGAIKKNANAVSRTTNAVEDVIVNAADSSTMGGAAIKQGIKTAQVTASVVAVGGKAVKTTVKVGVKTVKVVAKVPDTIKRFGVSHTRGYKKAYRYSKRKMRLVKRNFKPKAVFQGGKKIAGNITKIAKTGFKMGSGIAGKASSTLQNTLNSSDSTSGMAAGLAVKSASAAVTGVKVGAKVAKTGVKVTAKVTRTIATKIERKIQTGTAKRAIKTSTKVTEKAAKETAKAAVKTAKVTAKAVARLAKAVASAFAKFTTFIMSTAPMSFVIIGVFILIILAGGVFMAMCTN